MDTAKTIHILTNDARRVKEFPWRDGKALPARQECIASVKAIKSNTTGDDIVIISID